MLQMCSRQVDHMSASLEALLGENHLNLSRFLDKIFGRLQRHVCHDSNHMGLEFPNDYLSLDIFDIKILRQRGLTVGLVYRLLMI